MRKNLLLLYPLWWIDSKACTSIFMTHSLPYFRKDGILFSPQFNDVYHSSSGAVGQAEAVFLQGNNLPERWSTHPFPSFTILELGFGSGINCQVSLESWKHHSPKRPSHLQYIAIEAFPLSKKFLQMIHATHAQNPCFLNTYDPRQAEQFIPLPNATLHLLFQDVFPALSLLKERKDQKNFRIDALYLDGFSPKSNPDLWSEALFHHLRPLCHSKTTLASWCVAGSVRRALEAAGFWIKRMPGFGQKKQRLIGGTLF